MGRIKQREDQEKKAGPSARVDSLWRKKVESRKIFPIMFSLEGVGGTATSRLEDFILEEAQGTFSLRHDKPFQKTETKPKKKSAPKPR